MATETNFPPVFARLRATLIDNTPGAFIGKEGPECLALYTRQTQTPKPYEWFAGVEIKKNYVSYHLMSVYVYPDLVEDISDALRKRMQGKACFNFKTEDDALFAELAAVTRAGWERFQAQGWPARPLP